MPSTLVKICTVSIFWPNFKLSQGDIDEQTYQPSRIHDANHFCCWRCSLRNNYKADATKVDKAKQPKYAAGQQCSNCSLFQGKPADAAGGCPLFAGKQVAGKGWCSAYAKKA
jgi:hypothetical protein